MSQYQCSICGYIHDEAVAGKWESLPPDWKCPLCGAGKEAFVPRNAQPASPEPIPQPLDPERQVSALELSMLCSNLARGCEKQYMPAAEAGFRQLADYFRSQATPEAVPLQSLVDRDLAQGYPSAYLAAQGAGDRGALRSLVWSEKVTRMLASLLARWQREGEKMVENTGVYVCNICGFMYVGDTPPELCPVCKVHNYQKF